MCSLNTNNSKINFDYSDTFFFEALTWTYREFFPLFVPMRSRPFSILWAFITVSVTFFKTRIAQKRAWNGRETSRNIQVRSRTPRNYQEDWTVKTKESLYWSGWISSNRNAQCETQSLHQWTLVDYFLKPPQWVLLRHIKVIPWINLNRSSQSISQHILRSTLDKGHPNELCFYNE